MSVTRCNCRSLTDSGNDAALVFFLFDLLHLDGEDLRPRPLIERKNPLAALLANAPSPVHYSDHQLGQRRAFHVRDCTMLLSGLRHLHPADQLSDGVEGY